MLRLQFRPELRGYLCTNLILTLSPTPYRFQITSLSDRGFFM